MQADQPVHCLREKLYGMWEFHVSKDINNVNLYESKEVCTHSQSNKVQLLAADHKFSFANEEIIKVSLMDNYKVEASKEGSDVIKGKWSPIYDQAMMVELDNGLKFVTNFRYNFKAGDPKTADKSKFSEIKAGSYELFDSKCDETMVGHVLINPDAQKT